VLSTGNVDQAQGYLFGVPLPQREIAELVARMAPPAEVQGRRRAKT
jgi:EAL domain-containing protein (putative c-di-GMP-specific phosphodiesterase class I)